MRTKWLWLGVAAIALTSVALAQQPERPRRQDQPGFGFGGRMMGQNLGMMLLQRPDVQKELNLSQSQKAKLEQMQQEMRQAMQDMFNLSPEERREQMQALRQKYDPTSILNEAQRKRLRELELQWQGPMALTNPEIAQQLGLTQEQQAKIRGIMQETFQAMRPQPGQPGQFGGRMEEMQKAREQAEKKILEVLTPAQHEKWQQMLGKPFEFEGGRGMMPIGPRGGAGGARPRGGAGFGG